MSSFDVIEKQLDLFSGHNPGFAREEAGLVRLIRAVDKQVTDRANLQLRRFGLSMSEYNTLTMMDPAGHGVSVSELVARTGEKPSNITRLTDQLLKKGLIKRYINEDDRRVWMVSLSDAGIDLLDQIIPYISDQLHKVFMHVPADQRVAMEQSLKVLLTSLASEPI
ncbi:MarR family winged helix-turn-helix transcriptional regulator [Oceanobacter mangrovi]|uniref:MarR family winged helix-turn-helix transcriptional regulator n=1 Tax=Oceanobacter mangrovi TaxID=2862510 RepID=UPI001C8E3B41|nr:MarR family transcriptional regulator [Oceanobacter mangrovi]